MTSFQQYHEQIDAFVKVCHKLSANMYVTGHGGNLAWKLSADVILITPTQTNKGDITADDVVFIDPSGKVLGGRNKPTGETPMYLNFFHKRPDITSVIHCHPPVINTFAITKTSNWLCRPILPEKTTEVGPVPLAPYGEPLTQRLADNFLPFLAQANAFLMENHGLVMMSRGGIEWTMMVTEVLEVSCISILHALALGPIKEISREDVANLDNVMKTRNLPMFGAPGAYNSLLEIYYPD